MNDGCKYCNDFEDLPEGWIDGKPVGKVFDTSLDCYKSEITGKFGWFISIDGRDVGILYCPFCGRTLPRAK